MTEQEIQKLIADHTALRNDYTELSAKYATLKEEFALMQQQMDWLRKQLFGRKTEQTSVIMEGGTQLSMFSDEKENKALLKNKLNISRKSIPIIRCLSRISVQVIS